MNSLRDQVYPVTRSSNASECDVTFERYCKKKQPNKWWFSIDLSHPAGHSINDGIPK